MYAWLLKENAVYFTNLKKGNQHGSTLKLHSCNVQHRATSLVSKRSLIGSLWENEPTSHLIYNLTVYTKLFPDKFLLSASNPIFSKYMDKAGFFFRVWLAFEWQVAMMVCSWVLDQIQSVYPPHPLVQIWSISCYYHKTLDSLLWLSRHQVDKEREKNKISLVLIQLIIVSLAL